MSQPEGVKRELEWNQCKDTVEIEGTQFSRCAYHFGCVSDEKLIGDCEKEHFRSEGNDAPAVRCGKCLGDAFRIAYGSYECVAVCVGCGFSSVIYDG